MQAKPEEAAAASGPGSSASSSATTALARFDFSWFIPALVKYRKLLGEVLLISFMLQLFGLVSPLFFQVVMDKVLVHKGMTTLDVLVIGLVIVVIFESVLSALRAYVFSHTTSRIDVELGARLFRHLVALPLAYFQARRVGHSVARVRELENIRSFLTGNTLTVLLSLPLYFASAWRWCRSCARAGWLTLTGEHPRINTVACTPTLRHSHPTRLRGWFVGWRAIPKSERPFHAVCWLESAR